mgnify:CR=1 FL=1
MKTEVQENTYTQEMSLKEAMLQIVFLINNKRFDSALNILKGNEISLSSLSQNKSINNLEDFKVYTENS